MRSRLLFLLTLLLVAPAAAANDDLDALLDGVGEIASPGVPGPLVVFGDHAFPVVAGEIRKGIVAPVVAAARWGKGRVVVFGHGGYLHPAALETADTGRLVKNAVRWVAGGRPGGIGVHRNDGLRKFLEGSGAGDLSKLRVLCADSHHLGGREEEIAEFVEKGGGLITAGLGWGWLQLNPGKRLPEDHPGNRLLLRAGVLFGDGTLRRTSKKGYVVNECLTPFVHAGRALEVVIAGEGAKAEIAQAVWTAIHARRTLPDADRVLLPRFETLAKRPHGKADGALARLVLALQLTDLDRRPADDQPAHPLAAKFPGEVPANAKAVDRTIVVRTEVPGRHGTGLYARPAVPVRVTIPEGVTGLRLRIGAHSDRLWHKEEWSRAPEVCRTTPLGAPETRLACAFGGLVYVEVPPGRAGPGKVEVRIRGAVEAPRFVLGETNPEEWKTRIRKAPGPWAELETGKVILTVPSRVVRDLDDPEGTLRFWDRVMDACADLAGIPRGRRRPERYLADVQISAGYMHSGYPIMTHLDAAERMVRVNRLTKEGGSGWGLFHEMGHNHQRSEWTFAGTGEVTCNLFTLYVMEKVCGRAANTHKAIAPGNRAKTLRAYFEGGADFEVWKRKPFLALLTYLQVQEAFGWKAFIDVFAEYRRLPAAERPKNDAEKRDRWMVRLSRRVGRDLGPFFTAWGVPTSEAARNEIADLPAWMPEELEKARK